MTKKRYSFHFLIKTSTIQENGQQNLFLKMFYLVSHSSEGKQKILLVSARKIEQTYYVCCNYK